MSKSITAILLFIVLAGCETGDGILVQCNTPAILLRQDTALSVCGGYYIFYNEVEEDTLTIQYNQVLREFFLVNDLNEESFPISTFIEYIDLAEGERCRESLKELVCIQRRE